MMAESYPKYFDIKSVFTHAHESRAMSYLKGIFLRNYLQKYFADYLETGISLDVYDYLRNTPKKVKSQVGSKFSGTL